MSFYQQNLSYMNMYAKEKNIFNNVSKRNSN